MDRRRRRPNLQNIPIHTEDKKALPNYRNPILDALLGIAELATILEKESLNFLQAIADLELATILEKEYQAIADLEGISRNQAKIKVFSELYGRKERSNGT